MTKTLDRDSSDNNHAWEPCSPGPRRPSFPPRSPRTRGLWVTAARRECCSSACVPRRTGSARCRAELYGHCVGEKAPAWEAGRRGRQGHVICGIQAGVREGGTAASQSDKVSTRSASGSLRSPDRQTPSLQGTSLPFSCTCRALRRSPFIPKRGMLPHIQVWDFPAG